MHKPNSDSDEGVLAALLERFEKFRLPRALRLKEKVDAGEILSEADLKYLQKLLKDTGKLTPIIERNPKYQRLVVQAIHLYHHISEKALENEQKVG